MHQLRIFKRMQLIASEAGQFRRCQLRITGARVTPLPKSLGDPLPEVWVTLEGGQEEKLFEYYPDEISFDPQEFVGLTVSEARELKRKKDVDFLRN